MIANFLPLSWNPAVLLIIGLLIPLIPVGLRKAYMVALPIFAGLHLLSIPLGNYGEVELFGYTLTLMRLDGLSRVFALVFILATFLNVVYGWYVDDVVQ